MTDPISTLAQAAGVVAASETELSPDQREFARLIRAACVAAIEPGPFLAGPAHENTGQTLAQSQRRIQAQLGVLS
jgi:hypothetical protein